MKQTPDWSRGTLLKSPLFLPLMPLISSLATDVFPSLEDCNRLLEIRTQPISVELGARLCFVSQETGKLPFERQYEPRCYLHGEVPSRANNWHDLLNALVWMTFPKAKSAINARHYHALVRKNTIEISSKQGERGAVRDVNTLLDESGVIVIYSNTTLIDHLRNFRWKELFWLHREQVKAQMEFLIFGHGLYEKALHPYIGMTGQGLLLKVEDDEYFSWKLEHRLEHVDRLMANHLASPYTCNDTRDLSPVPLLGVPGWTPENEHAVFYDNSAYFRTGRSR